MFAYDISSACMVSLIKISFSVILENLLQL